MTPEEVARANQFRDGFTLVDYSEVGLPIFRLTIEAVTTGYRELPTIQEFVMRCLLLGEIEEVRISRMLGLNPEIVAAATDVSMSDGYVSRNVAYSKSETFSLTDAGRARLAKARLEIPQEEMLVIDYDGIRRVPVRVAGASVLRLSEMRATGAIEIRPYPATLPTVKDLMIPEVTRVIRRQDSEEFRRSVLALKRIVRRGHVYKEAVGLVFVDNRTKEVQVSFAIEGKLSEAHERAFAENEGPRKMGFVRSVGGEDPKKRLERVVGKGIVQAFPAPSELAQLRLGEKEAEAEVVLLRPSGENSVKGSPSWRAFSKARENLAVARNSINMIQCRPLACYEQLDLLAEALEHATRELLISSSGLQSHIVTAYFVRRLEQLSDNGAVVRIDTLLTPQRDPRTTSYFDPLAELTRRSERGRLRLIKAPAREFFALVQDSVLAVVSNRPFLGEVARRSSFIRVTGLVTRDRGNVGLIKDIFFSNSRGSRRSG